MHCIIIVVSVSDKWGIRSRSSHTDFMSLHITVVRSIALAMPRVHRHNRVPKARMRVVA